VQAEQHLRRSRPYRWGAIYLNDVDCQEHFDIDFHDGDAPVLSTASHIAVTVIHPYTVDKEAGIVTLDVQVRTQRAIDMPYEVAFDVPSGTLSIGDADGFDEVTLRPGRWLLQFAVDHPAEARHVEIVMSPL
jgi:hypothetical protein